MAEGTPIAPISFINSCHWIRNVLKYVLSPACKRNNDRNRQAHKIIIKQSSDHDHDHHHSHRHHKISCCTKLSFVRTRFEQWYSHFPWAFQRQSHRVTQRTTPRFDTHDQDDKVVSKCFNGSTIKGSRLLARANTEQNDEERYTMLYSKTMRCIRCYILDFGMQATKNDQQNDSF